MLTINNCVVSRNVNAQIQKSKQSRRQISFEMRPTARINTFDDIPPSLREAISKALKSEGIDPEAFFYGKKAPEGIDTKLTRLLGIQDKVFDGLMEILNDPQCSGEHVKLISRNIAKVKPQNRSKLIEKIIDFTVQNKDKDLLLDAYKKSIHYFKTEDAMIQEILRKFEEAASKIGDDELAERMNKTTQTYLGKR